MRKGPPAQRVLRVRQVQPAPSGHRDQRVRLVRWVQSGRKDQRVRLVLWVQPERSELPDQWGQLDLLALPVRQGLRDQEDYQERPG